jgi:hypothetical protein
MAGRSRERQPRVVRLPGFVSDEAIGLGDARKRATSMAGVRPCRGCSERAARLNQWIAIAVRRDPWTGKG